MSNKQITPIEWLKDIAKVGIFTMIFLFMYQGYTYIYSKPYIIEQTCANTYTVDLEKTITDDIEAYHNLHIFLKTLSEKDTVIFKIHGYGGSVLSCVEVINGIKETKAHTIADVTSTSYSAHAFIGSAVQEVRMGKYSYLMFHAAQSQGTITREMQEASVGRLFKEAIDKGMITQEDADRMVADSTVEVYWWPGKVVNKQVEAKPEGVI